MSPEVPIIILLLAIPLFFIVKWLLKLLRIGNKKNRKYIAMITSIILSPLIYVGTIVIMFYILSYYPTQEFDKNLWDQKIEERYKMSQDIIDNNLLIGKSKEEVIELLGNDFSTYKENIIEYYLGFVPGFINIDPDCLFIYFEDNKVIKVEQLET